MNKNKEEAFMQKVTPIVLQYASYWFQGTDEVNENGAYRGCAFCDMHCGNIDHDDDCVALMSKKCKEEWEAIDASTKWDLGWNKKFTAMDTPRSLQDIQFFKHWNKYRAFFKIFMNGTDMFVPLDYTDPSNGNVICGNCDWDLLKSHGEDCPIVGIAHALSELYKPT